MIQIKSQQPGVIDLKNPQPPQPPQNMQAGGASTTPIAPNVKQTGFDLNNPSTWIPSLSSKPQESPQSTMAVSPVKGAGVLGTAQKVASIPGQIVDKGLGSIATGKAPGFDSPTFTSVVQKTAEQTPMGKIPGFAPGLAMGVGLITDPLNYLGGGETEGKLLSKIPELDATRDGVVGILKKMVDEAGAGAKNAPQAFNDAEEALAKLMSNKATTEDLRKATEVARLHGGASVGEEIAGLSKSTLPEKAPTYTKGEGGLFTGSKATEKPFKNFPDLSTKLLGKLEGRTTVSKQFIEDLTNSADLKQPERDLFRNLLQGEGDTVNVKDFANKVKTELLPLERSGASAVKQSDVDAAEKLARKTGDWKPYEDLVQKQEQGAYNFGARYENVTLPDELRGPVANYSEHIYQSPIKTTAGDVHFSNAEVENKQNYFAHTRIEDLPTKPEQMGNYQYDFSPRAFKEEPTRRVIELQSDLFQKGRLHEEIMNRIRTDRSDFIYNGKKLEVLSYDEGAGTVTGRIGGGRETKIPISDFETQNAKKFEEINKLRAFENNWSPRIIREEVKQAAKDGKTKLQFPTGETAMKIEGLGDTKKWYEIPKNVRDFGTPPLAPDKLRVGMQTRNNNGEDWIITDVLGDGKFKAISKSTLDEFHIKPNEIERLRQKAPETWNNRQETFDISGKVDTNNPIYKFYEKEVGKYLKNKYGATLITDPQGVKWWEVKVDKGMKNLPVEAFGVAAIPMVMGDKKKK